MKRFFSLLVSAAFLFSLVGIKQPLAVAGTRGGQTIRFVPKVIKEADARLRYTITAQYPQSAGRDARLSRLNQQLGDFVAKEIAGFKREFAPPEERLSEAGSYYEFGYEVELASHSLVSITFSTSTYYEGAEHPNHTTATFKYDLDSEQTLNLSDLFQPNSNYLSLMADYGVQDLKKQFESEGEAEGNERGARAEEENYKSWSITSKGLKVTFDPHQVAYYSQTPYEVIIPYAVLKDLINPAGALARVTRE